MRVSLTFLVVLSAIMGGCAVAPHDPLPAKSMREIDPCTRRGFWLYVPSTYNPSRPAPLIVTCHGTWPFDVSSMHIREWEWYGEQNGCIVVAPDLIDTDGILGDGPVNGMLLNERYILSAVSLLGYRYNIDRSNVMITGFSGGGFPTYWVGLRHPDIFSVVVARNCNFNQGHFDGWWSPDALRTTIKVYYGQNDAGAIKDQSERGIEYLRSRGFSVTTEILPNVGHERRPEVAMTFFRSHWRQPKPTFVTASR